MKIFICSSKYFYQKIPDIKEYLESLDHIITLPNSYDYPMKEEEIKKVGRTQHSKWKGDMIRLQNKKINDNDAILVLNFEKNNYKNYIGGATFLEMYKAFELNKKIFLFNDIPEGILKDEIIRFNPIIINGNLNLIK
jgi:hypothetical protein